MSNSNSSKQVLLSVIGVAILVVAVVGVSFAFFNYTRTGDVNQVRTGTIVFESTQTRINVENVFPVSSEDVGTDTTNVKTAEVTIRGNTTYNKGIDFVVRATDVDVTAGETGSTVNVPLNVMVTQTNLTGVTNLTLGTFNKTTPLAENSVLASGKIPANTNVNGTLSIQVYLDASEIAITDTLEGDTNVPAGYTNGTTNTWLDGRQRLTTDQWNSLASSPLSFKITVEANEGA